MTAQGYVTVFEVTQKGFEWWWPAIPLGLTILFGAIAWFQRKNFFKPTSTSLVMLACTIFGAFLFVIMAWTAYDEFTFVRQAYSNQDYVVAEGKIEKFRPGPYGGGQECFHLEGKRFCYSDYRITPAFNNTASHGGPMRADLPVRIAYVETAGPGPLHPAN